MRGVTCDSAEQTLIAGLISTHTPHARRDAVGLFLDMGLGISTHTPHARRDYRRPVRGRRTAISTHTPHARRDIGAGRFAMTEDCISTHTPHARRDLDGF